MSRNISTPVLLLFVGIVVVFALSSAFLAPLELTLRSYMELADVLLSGSKLHDCFLPVGYAAFVALSRALHSAYGLVLVQAGIYLLAVWLTWRFLRERLKDAPTWLIWLTISLVSFHPYMLINIHRVNDNAINVCLMIILWAWMKAPKVDASHSTRSTLITGIAFGILVLTRPNSVTLAPVLLLAVILPRKPLRNIAKPVGILLIASLLTYGLLAWAISGSATFWPGNGAYNLYAGNNPYSNATLIAKGNGEESIEPALRDKNLLPQGKSAETVDPAILKTLAHQHIQAHPLDFAKGLVIKAWVLLGPDLRQAHSLPNAVVKWALASPAIIWLLLLLRSLRMNGRHIDWMPVLFIALYMAPFVVFNADARMRSPLLDVLFLLHAAALYWDQRRLTYRPFIDASQARPQEA